MTALTLALVGLGSFYAGFATCALLTTGKIADMEMERDHWLRVALRASHADHAERPGEVPTDA